jgi:cell division protein FtsB
LKLKKISVRLTPTTSWLALFSVWLVLLSGILSDFTGTPGVLQAFRLRHLLEGRRAQVAALEQSMLDLEREHDLLEKDVKYQAAEIRRVLGYVGPDEVVFDFNRSE